MIRVDIFGNTISNDLSFFVQDSGKCGERGGKRLGQIKQEFEIIPFIKGIQILHCIIIREHNLEADNTIMRAFRAFYDNRKIPEVHEITPAVSFFEYLFNGHINPDKMFSEKVFCLFGSTEVYLFCHGEVDGWETI